MTNKPLISVVLPVYNCELYIKEAIDSILNQTIQDFEIIAIDDCSTDDTIKIIETISDNRIRIIKKEVNKGLIDSLNIGFAESKGKYIARMDGDDISVASRFEKQLKVLEENEEIKACGSWLQCFGASDKIIKHQQFHKCIQAQLLINNPMSLGATMLVKEAFEDFNFDISKIHVEDYDFWAKTAWTAEFYNIQEVLYYYRIHTTQVSTQFKNIQLKGDIAIKLSLFHKFEYDRNKFTDEWITKIVFTRDSFNIEEIALLFEWFKLLVFLNKEEVIFDKQEFKKVIASIQRHIIFQCYFTNERIGMNYNFRKKLLSFLPVKELLFVFRKKIKEKIKFLKLK